METVWQTSLNPPDKQSPHKQDYIFLNGRRYVRPYYFEFIAHVKNRWAGKNIVDLFTHEFKGRNHEYYVSAVKSGRIQVEGKIVPVSYIVKSSEKITHFLHRHEPPVLDLGITILEKDSNVITICKPASVPVHPCGQYRKNTVLGILEAEHDLAPVFPIHRLDRLVSGLLILARTAKQADIFRQHIMAGKVHKQYVAKVLGVFPEEEIVVNANIDHDGREQRSTAEVGDSNSDAPIKGKASCTKFTRMSTDGVHSIVLCEPVTGRTHQIRVHLQFTGHPIANDLLYLSKEGVDRSIDGFSADRAAAASSDQISRNGSRESKEGFVNDFNIDPMCTNCPNLGPYGYDADEEGLWLHCVKYSGPDWTYECPFPDWSTLS